MQTPRFSWSTRPNGEGAYLVSAQGELDLHASPQRGDERLELVAAGAGDVGVDLSEVTLIDSTALGLLLRAARLLRASGGRMRIVGASPHVKRLLELTALDREILVMPAEVAA